MAGLNISDYLSYTAATSGSDNMSTLFSSVNKNKNNASASLFGQTDLMGVNISDYASVKSGSYYKLMKKQYGAANQTASKEELEAFKKKQDVTADKAASLSSTINDLMDMKYKDSDKDAIVDKVKKFADEYNSMIKNASSSTLDSVKQKAGWMKNMISEYSNTLGKVGLSVTAEGEIKVSEEDLKGAKMESLKDVFGLGTNSISNKVLYKAEQIYSLAKTYGSSATAYTSNGTYNRDYSSNYDTTT